MNEPNRNTMRDTAAIVLMAVAVTFGCAGGLLLIVRPGQVQVASQPPLSPAASEYSQRDAAQAESIPSAVPPSQQPDQQPTVGEYQLNGQFNGQVTALATSPPLVENGYEVVGPTSRKPALPHPGQRYLDTDLDTYSIYNGTSWLSVNTSAGVGVIDDIGDVTITSAAVGDFLGWNGANWADLTISLDTLSDVAITSPVVKHTLRHNGTNWVNSTLAATDLSDINFASLADADIASYDSGTSKWVNESAYENQRIISVTDYGAIPDDAIDDTTAIQAAIDAAAAASPATAFLPRGTYLVGSLTIAPTAADVTLEGPGAVLQRNGTGVLLQVRGDRCKVRNLEFDGVDYNNANTALIQVAGVSSPLNNAEDNLIEHCYLHDTFDADFGSNGTTAADGIQVLTAVDSTTLRFCHVHECGGNGIRFTGYDQRVEYCKVTEYHNRGFRGYQGTRLWMTGCYAETTQDVYNGGAPCLIDPGVDGLEECYITGCFFYINRDQSPDVGTQALKLAHIEKSVVTATTCKAAWSEGTTHRAVRLEDCLRSVVFRDCRLRGNVFLTETGHGGIVSQADDGGFVRFTMTGDRVIIDPDDNDDGVATSDDAQELYIHNTGVASYNRVHLVTDVSTITDNGLGTSPRYQFTVLTDIPYTAGSIDTATAFWRSTPDMVAFEHCEFGDEEYEADAAANGDANRQVAIENLNARISKVRDCIFRMGGTSTAIEWAVDNDAYFERLEMVNNEFTWSRAATCIAMSMENPTNSLITSGKIIASDNRMVNAGAGSTLIVRISNSIESGTCASGSTTTVVNIGEFANGTEIFEGKVFTVNGESRRITDYTRVDNAPTGYGAEDTSAVTLSSALGGAPMASDAWTMADVTYNDRNLLFATDGSNSKRFVTTTGTIPLETATDSLGVLDFDYGDIILNSPNNATKPLAWVYTTGGWVSYGAKPMQTIINSGNTPYTFDKSNHDMTFRINSANCLLNLPAVTTSPSGALAGLRVRVVFIEGGLGASNANADTGDAFEIDPNGSEIIVLPGATNSAGKKLRLDGDTDRAGDAVILEAGTDRWYVVSVNGTWSKEP